MIGSDRSRENVWKPKVMKANYKYTEQTQGCVYFTIVKKIQTIVYKKHRHNLVIEKKKQNEQAYNAFVSFQIQFE